MLVARTQDPAVLLDHVPSLPQAQRHAREVPLTRGQWVVAVRDIPSNTDELVGPYHSEDKADGIARRLRRDIAAVGAEHIMEAVVYYVRPGSIEFDDVRDEMLRDLEELGYSRASNQDTDPAKRPS